MKKHLKITEYENERLDVLLSNTFPEFSRSYFSNLIKVGFVLVNNKAVKPSYIPKSGDDLEVVFAEKEEYDLAGEKIELNIVYEDSNVIVINKQPGLVVHPAAGNESGTLVNALINHFPEIKKAIYQKGNKVSESRPGLVHRLDKDTSGVMIVAKNARAMHSLSRQIQNRTVKKYYLALCSGWPKQNRGELINHLGRDPKDRKKMAEIGEKNGKIAISRYEVIDYFLDKYKNKISLIEFEILTGRTHQIRIQSKLVGHPVVGDQFYYINESKKITEANKLPRQMLHAKKLIITLPGENQARIFEADLPVDFSSFLQQLQRI